MSKLISIEKLQQLEEELAYRLGKLSIEIANELDLAWQEGDERENSPLDEAKDKYIKNQKRILEIQAVLKSAKNHDNHKKLDHIQVDSFIEIISENGDKIVYHIVSTPNPNITKFEIYFLSEVGLYLIGKKKYEDIKINNRNYKIIDIYI